MARSPPWLRAFLSTRTGLQGGSRRLVSPRPRHHSTTRDLPLSGLKVLDLSRVLAGPFCTQVLADYGADVLKVEEPTTGDETRQWRTAGEAQKWKHEHPLMSLYFAAVNRNKRSMTVNLKHDTGREIVRRLVRQSDVLVHNFRPGAMERWGLGYEGLSQANPCLIYAAVSGYGATGPSRDRAGYDAIALAEAGLLHITGDAGSGPTKPGVAMADLCTALYTHGAILAALAQRQRTGRGCPIDASLFESSPSLLINVGLASLNLDRDGPADRRRRGQRLGLGHPNLVPYGGFATQDGRVVFIAANNNGQWRALCRQMDMAAMGDDARFGTNAGRVEHRDEINAALQRQFRTKTKDEWMTVFAGSGLPYGAVNDVVEAFEHAQSEARGMVQVVPDFDPATDGLVRLIAPAIKFGDAETATATCASRPLPLLGEDTAAVLGGLGYQPHEIAAMKESGAV